MSCSSSLDAQETFPAGSVTGKRPPWSVPDDFPGLERGAAWITAREEQQARPLPEDPTQLDLELDGHERKHPLQMQSAPQQLAHRRYGQRRSKIVDALWASADPEVIKRAERLGHCCCCPTLRRGPDGKAIPEMARCRDRLCPRCAEIRARECAIKTLVHVQAMNSPRFFTFTLKHVDESLANSTRHLSESLSRLWAHPKWKARVVGGICGVEVTRNMQRGEWHAHAHVIADGEFFPHELLKTIWTEVSGGSYIVHVEAIHDRKKAADYISRYVAKPADVVTWSPECVREYATAMKGKRLINTFGNRHGVPLDSDDKPDVEEPSTHLLHAYQLTDAAVRGYEPARRAIEILRRMGPIHAMCVGQEPLPPGAAVVPVEDWEHEFVVRVCEVIHMEYPKIPDAWLTPRTPGESPPPVSDASAPPLFGTG